jgi:hypothetical protein
MHAEVPPSGDAPAIVVARCEIPEVERSGLEMADDLNPDQQQFLEAACGIANRFEEYQVDEEALMRCLGWDNGEFSRVRNELEDAGYITRRGAPQSQDPAGFRIAQAGIELCPEPLGGRDALQLRE